MSGVGTGIALAAGLGVAGSVAGAAISSSGAQDAATTQANAADEAAQIQAKEAANALAFQKQQWSTTQANEAPWIAAGKSGLSRLQALLNSGPGGLLQGFTAPTLAQAEQEPGYQFGLTQGEEALQNSAAARGSLISGNTLEAVNNFAQNYAQNDYTNVYNRAFNTFETNQNNTFNRLAALSGIGQTAVNTEGSLGAQTANNIAGTELTAGAQQGQDIQNAAAAEASGYVGSANAWSGAFSNGTNNLMNLILLSQLGNNGTSPNIGNNYLDVPSMPLTPSDLGLSGPVPLSGAYGG